MPWRRDAAERMSIDCTRIDEEACCVRHAPERVSINFEKERNEKNVLDEKGCYKDDFHPFRIRIE